MSHRIAQAVLSAVCLLAPAVLMATDLIPVEDFARRAQLSMPRLSPDGQYLALRMDDETGNSHSLVVYKVSDMSHPASVLHMPKYELPGGIVWVSSTRLLVEYGKQFGSVDKPELTGEILATDVNGKHQDYLFGYQDLYGSRSDTRAADRGWGFVAELPESPNNHFYMSAELWENKDHSWLYDVDAVKNTRHLVGDLDVGNMEFMVGSDGQAHYAYGTNSNYNYVVYHHEANGWAPMSPSQVGHNFVPIYTAQDHQHIYAYYSAKGGPYSLVEQDEMGGDRRVLAADAFGRVGDIMWTAPPRQPFATSVETGVPKAIYTDPNLPAAKLHLAISQKFPGEFVNFINYSENGGELLFSVSSDRDPGTYYLIDTTHYKVIKLFSSADWIDPDKMAERRPMRFTASDGMPLEAILTIPRGQDLKKLPMILLPHGGPHGISDDWYFDDDAQFLASRGYLVLQVNYRGSGGRGHNFEEAGYRNWGTRIQQDLIDGVKWAEGEHYADPERVCVYGASFGGYSAMMTAIRAPDLFKCAVGYAGIYDLRMMYDKGDIQEDKSGRSYLQTVIGKDDADLDANSPDKLADKINVPVLLVHGENDQRAPFAQAKAMRAALDAAHKPYEWLSKSGEGHGFYEEKNNIEFYTLLQTFIAKHIGAGNVAH
ncbi:prolyl oligopeptidase family serine peptidase [Rhodanobacter sp. L36]|uniref:alpha/beta hydrolase family protein n=1 Tax=Rhodanobacter sp. L36 TaxID=1747221 RepID=UPI00131BF5FA|nr:prolyl oligopeptidase family serine peptidase [Rhodanobacter sp. L36]